MTREQSKFENEQNNNDKKKYIQQIPGNIKIHELQKITLLGNISHLKKGTLYQRDLYLILTLDPRNGLGYYMLYYGVNLVKEDNNNNNNNNNNKAFDSVPHDHATWNTLHQIEFYLILTLGPRDELGYCVLLWYNVKDSIRRRRRKRRRIRHWRKVDLATHSP